MDYLSVPSSKNAFIFSSFLKDVFTGYRVPDWSSFLPTQPPVPGTLKMLGNFLLASMVSEEKLAVVQIIVYLHGFVFAVVLAAFKIFFFILIFSSLITLCLGRISISCSGFTKRLKYVNLCLHQIWDIFSLYYFLLFSPFSFPSPFLLPSPISDSSPLTSLSSHSSSFSSSSPSSYFFFLHQSLFPVLHGLWGHKGQTFDTIT